MKVILYMAMTANGIIARENDETPWSAAEWKNYSREVKKSRALIIGRRTYEIMNKNSEFKRLGNPFTIVLTGQPIKASKNFIFVSSPQKAVDTLHERKIRRAILGGGSKTNSEFLKSDLIDEIILDVEPMIFGNGIKLFAEDIFESRLALIKIRKLSKDEVQLHYKVIKNGKKTK